MGTAMRTSWTGKIGTEEVTPATHENPFGKQRVAKYGAVYMLLSFPRTRSRDAFVHFVLEHGST